MWARLANVAIGVWLMAAPAVLGYGGVAATNDRIFGPTAAAAAIIAMSDVTRPLRWVNLAIGIWLAVAPVVLGYATVPLVSSLTSGVAMSALSFVGGEVREKFGGGWSELVTTSSKRSRPS